MIDSRVRNRRTGAILATALFTLALMPGLATAANTRTLWIGSPDAQANAGKLDPTPVTIPAAAPAPQHLTLVDVQIKSTDNQTLAHTVLTITLADYAGFSLNSYSDTTNCDDDGRIITCDYGNLEALGTRTVTVLANVTSDFVFLGQPATLFSATVATNNENGTNQQLFTATSGPFPGPNPGDPPDPGFQVGDHSANGLSTFVPAGLRKLFTSALGTDGAGNLSTTIEFTAGARETVSITEGPTSNLDVLYPCPSGLNCQPVYSQAVTASGTFGSPKFFHWTLSALVPKTYALSQGFVVHYPAGATSFDPTDPQAWILYFKSKASFCGSLDITANGHCIKTLSLTKYDKTFNLLTVEVVMDHQGGMRV